MASVTFNGTTIWTDATTGRGLVGIVGRGLRTRWAAEPYPRGEGEQLKDLGSEGGNIQVSVVYHLTEGERLALDTTLEGLRRLVGSLVDPDGVTLGYCALVDWDIRRGGVVETPGGVTRRVYGAAFLFRQARG